MADRNPTRVRVLADSETKEWSVLLPTIGIHDLHPSRLFVRVERGLVYVEESWVTSPSETAECVTDGEGDSMVFGRAQVRWLLDVLPAALDRASEFWSDPQKALHEDRHPLSVLTLARQVARELRQKKLQWGSPWLKEECELLGVLCSVLGVDRHDGGLER